MCCAAARGKVCLLILSCWHTRSLHESAQLCELGVSFVQKNPFRCPGCSYMVDNVVGCTELDQRFPQPGGTTSQSLDGLPWGGQTPCNSFPDCFADFQPFVGQGLPELDASVFGSPQVGMLMEEKPPPSLRAVRGLPPAGGEPRARDVAAVPARSGGASFAAGGSSLSASQTPGLPTHPCRAREMYPHVSRKPRARPAPRGDTLACERRLSQQSRECRLKDDGLTLT